MNDERMQSLLDAWFRDTDPRPPDTTRTVVRLMARLPEIRQRGRRWPFPPFRRKAQSPTASDTTDYRPAPIPATNGHAPTVIGRTQTMFSPVKAIVAGALVFALGGMFLIAQPFGQQGSVPGAEQAAELAPPVVVTITETEGTGVEDEECDGEAPAICAWGSSAQWSATDPRLSGTATMRATEYFWEDGGIIESYAVEVVSDVGTWVGTGRNISAREFGGLSMFTLSGEGGYEGLSALLTSSEDGIFKAVIIEGELPPFPELPAE